jgi:hypothetical protein
MNVPQAYRPSPLLPGSAGGGVGVGAGGIGGGGLRSGGLQQPHPLSVAAQQQNYYGKSQPLNDVGYMPQQQQQHAPIPRTVGGGGAAGAGAGGGVYANNIDGFDDGGVIGALSPASAYHKQSSYAYGAAGQAHQQQQQQQPHPSRQQQHGGGAGVYGALQQQQQQSQYSPTASTYDTLRGGRGALDPAAAEYGGPQQQQRGRGDPSFQQQQIDAQYGVEGYAPSNGAAVPGASRYLPAPPAAQQQQHAHHHPQHQHQHQHIGGRDYLTPGVAVGGVGGSAASNGFGRLDRDREFIGAGGSSQFAIDSFFDSSAAPLGHQSSLQSLPAGASAGGSGSTIGRPLSGGLGGIVIGSVGGGAGLLSGLREGSIEVGGRNGLGGIGGSGVGGVGGSSKDRGELDWSF